MIPLCSVCLQLAKAQITSVLRNKQTGRLGYFSQTILMKRTCVSLSIFVPYTFDFAIADVISEFWMMLRNVFYNLHGASTRAKPDSISGFESSIVHSHSRFG